MSASQSGVSAETLQSFFDKTWRRSEIDPI